MIAFWRLLQLILSNGTLSLTALSAVLIEISFVYPILITVSLDFYISNYYLIFILLILFPLLCLQNYREKISDRRTKIKFLSRKFELVITLTFFGLFISNILTLNNITNILETAQSNAMARYAGTSQVTIFYRLQSIVIIMLSAILPIMQRTSNKSYITHFLFLMWVSLILLDSLVQAARAFLMINFCIYFGSMLAFKLLQRGHIIFKFKQFFQSLSLVITLFSFGIFIQFSRSGSVNLENLSNVIKHLSIWAFGHISALSHFIHHNVNESIFNLKYLSSSFLGFFNMIGIVDRIDGVYYPVDIGSGRSTNLFSMFRNLIEDLSIIGALIILPICILLIENVKPSSARLVLTSTYISFLTWGFAYSIFIFNNVLVGFFLASILILYRLKIERATI